MALEGVEGSASHPGHSLPQGKTQYPLYRRLGGPQGQSGQVRKISPPPGFDPQTVHPVAICYTNYATQHMECWWDTPLMLVCHFGDLSFLLLCMKEDRGLSSKCIQHSPHMWPSLHQTQCPEMIAITTHVFYLILMASVTRIRTDVWNSCLHYAWQCISSQQCIWWQVVKTVDQHHETFVAKLLETRLNIGVGWEVQCKIV